MIEMIIFWIGCFTIGAVTGACAAKLEKFIKRNK